MSLSEAPAAAVPSPAPTFLPADAWAERARAHAARIDGWLAGHRERRARGEAHPVEDFLFTYYSLKPARLREWHPGPDVVLGGPEAREYRRWPAYREVDCGVAVDPAAWPTGRRDFLDWLAGLLAATAERPPFFGCFGWHEWAMVYRQTPDEVRHNRHPLRFPPDTIARIVEGGPQRCSHHDAFRFFTAPARPLNRLQPRREDVPALEQRGCLHANMDLYKWAGKLLPFTPGELLADTFELARDIRAVDMRASPYDLRALGFEPIPIETAAGRATYEALQRGFTARGEPLRARLAALVERLRRG